MLETVLPVPFWLELAAALTGGISGAMSAVRARYDIFGTVCIACTCGLLGGVIRDVLLQNYGIYAFQKPTLILACAVAGVVVFYFGKLATYLDPIVDLLDNISVALWAVLSVGKGLSAGLDIVPSIILGTVTAVGGGIMRDVFMNREPEAFQAGTLYGSAALVGSAVYALMRQNHLLEQWAPFACVALVLILRYASLFFGWRTKPPRDYSDVVTKAVARPVQSVARRVRPPKGKIEREKERELQKSGKLIRLRNRRAGESAAPRHVEPSDPSDRILVKDLSEIRDDTLSEPKDPFEPQTPDPEDSLNR
ncbi:trimeric intracellular cation channel family protein [Raoultibacter phocaeensis]|uniref:trimeric intracellular cation channel family protein n=1 Tax=Raoultibacter phocaeensis TaxID=2479841 RepID=UPI001119901E|nr:trimeric intracellular cation channel family protein [Raoultibacter phocaeensis]